MQIDLISMPRHEARAAFLEYKKSVRDRHTEEDLAVMRGYRAIARGSALLDLRSALTAAGQDAQLRPKIAITRADYKWCWFTWVNGGRRARFVGTHNDDVWEQGGKSYANNTVTVPPHVLQPPEGNGSSPHWRSSRALVPYIPPAVRPKHALSNYHILWEAEWQPVPPTDPLLLKHLGGTL